MAGEESSPQLTVTDQLCQSIAHDLRGVLMAIQLSVEELTTPGVRAEELQAELLAAIARATQLASELAVLARPTASCSEVFDAGLLIDQLQRMLRRNVPVGIDLRLELSRDPCFVAAPRMTFKRVLLTLFNHVTARLRLEGPLTIRTAISDESTGARVIVSVGEEVGAQEWDTTARVPVDARHAPGFDELCALVRRLDAELYARGDLDRSPQFWLCLSRARPSARG